MNKRTSLLISTASFLFCSSFVFAEVSRDPFWPIGYVSKAQQEEARRLAELEKKKAEEKEKPVPIEQQVQEMKVVIDENKVTDSDWLEAKKTLKFKKPFSARNPRNGKIVTKIRVNNGTYENNDSLCITNNNISFTWKVLISENNKVSIQKLEAYKVHETKKEIEDKKKKHHFNVVRVRKNQPTVVEPKVEEPIKGVSAQKDNVEPTAELKIKDAIVETPNSTTLVQETSLDKELEQKEEASTPIVEQAQIEESILEESTIESMVESTDENNDADETISADIAEEILEVEDLTSEAQLLEDVSEPDVEDETETTTIEDIEDASSSISDAILSNEDPLANSMESNTISEEENSIDDILDDVLDDESF